MAYSDDEIRLQLFQGMMERSSEGVVFVDSETRISVWNRAAELRFGLDADEFRENSRVRNCLIPSLQVIEQVVSAPASPVSDTVSFELTPESSTRFVRVIQSIDVCGEKWLMLHLKDSPLKERSDSELYLQTRTDHLSNLLNRRGFQSTLEENLNRRLALAIIDVDFFKLINDNFGHQTGDRAIKWIADRLTESFKDALCIGRLGGDEFGVVLEVTDPGKIENRFASLCHEVSADAIAWYPEGISISIGVAIANKSGVSARELLSKADRAMYQSKNQGRNRSTCVHV